MRAAPDIARQTVCSLGLKDDPLIILTIVGARPQFVKASVVSRPLRSVHREILLHTGQHYDDGMSQRFFRELDIPKPDYELGVGSGSHGRQTAQMLVGIEEAIERERPDRILVYGDTNSTLAGALAAAKLHVPIAHVEAGLRSFNRRMPEEINRVITDRLSDVLFCPSESAARNLEREGITRGVHVIGDVMAEAVQQFGALAEETIVERLGAVRGGYVLATVHRAENTDDPERLKAIVRAFEALDEPVIVPAHPRLCEALGRNSIVPGGGVRLIDPVGYFDMIALERNARAILTDSGGVQKEAYWLGVPCVTLRNETEWVETVEAGWNVLAGADTIRIVDAARHSSPPPSRPRLYGEGGATRAIVDHLSRMA
jgi:UDP-GlcNAc3NAcA epimerase